MFHIYTDGSCQTQLKIGVWAFVVQGAEEAQFGVEENTTNNAMELQAAIEAIDWAIKRNEPKVALFTDSQYVHQLPKRMEALQCAQFTTKAGKPIRNQIRVIKLNDLLSTILVEIHKVPAHSKDPQFKDNRAVDIFCRQQLRLECNKRKTTLSN